jgi:hypothetical protein
MLFNTFDERMTERIIAGLQHHLNPHCIFAVLEDTEKRAYKKCFTTIFEGMVDVADRTKYVFVGKI